jgi:TonB family protein
MNAELKRSIVWSALLHALAIVAFIRLYDSFLVTRTPLLMELTLIGDLSRGEGLGADRTTAGVDAGSLPQTDTGKGEFGSPSRKAGETDPSRTQEGDVSLAPRTPLPASEGIEEDDRHIRSLRDSAPIGIDPRRATTRRIKTTAGLGRSGVAGSPDGNAAIEGQLASRGVKRKVFPAYPEWAKKQGVEGTVKYRITVLPNGLLKDDISVEQTSGYREMDRIVYESLIQWEFEPLPAAVAQVEQGGVIQFIFDFKQGVTAP